MFSLSLYLIFYCFLHSILADNILLKKIYYKWWYRFFYVLQSTLLLLPAIYFYTKIPSIIFIKYSILTKTVLLIIQITIIIFTLYASKSYDNDFFLGIKQIKEYLYKGKKYFTDENKLNYSGILSVIRHPYYFAGIIFLWARELYTKDLIVNIIFTLYFILGAINEERKLVKQFGQEYINYKKEVPMLFPAFWRIIWKH